MLAENCFSVISFDAPQVGEAQKQLKNCFRLKSENEVRNFTVFQKMFLLPKRIETADKRACSIACASFSNEIISSRKALIQKQSQWWHSKAGWMTTSWQNICFKINGGQRSHLIRVFYLNGFLFRNNIQMKCLLTLNSVRISLFPVGFMQRRTDGDEWWGISSDSLICRVFKFTLITSLAHQPQSEFSICLSFAASNDWRECVGGSRWSLRRGAIISCWIMGTKNMKSSPANVITHENVIKILSYLKSHFLLQNLLMQSFQYVQ